MTLPLFPHRLNPLTANDTLPNYLSTAEAVNAVTYEAVA